MLATLPIMNNDDPNDTEAHVMSVTVVSECTPEELLHESDELQACSQNCRAPYISITVANRATFALLDSGSDITCMSQEFFQSLSLTQAMPLLPVTSIHVHGAFGTTNQRILSQTFLPVSIGVMSYDIVFLIVPRLSCDIIMGADWLHANDVKLDFETNSIIIANNVIHFHDSGISNVLQTSSSDDEDSDVAVVGDDVKMVHGINHIYRNDTSVDQLFFGHEPGNLGTTACGDEDTFESSFDPSLMVLTLNRWIGTP